MLASYHAIIRNSITIVASLSEKYLQLEFLGPGPPVLALLLHPRIVLDCRYLTGVTTPSSLVVAFAEDDELAFVFHV